MGSLEDLKRSFVNKEVVTTYFYGELTGEIVSDAASSEEESFEVDGWILKHYADEIQKQVELSQAELAAECGLAAYIYETSLAQKVKSITVGVAVIDDMLYSKTKVESYGAFCDDELHALKEYLIGQFADGWGEGFEQTGIPLSEETLYVHFYQLKREFALYMEEEFTILQQHDGMMMGSS